MPRSNRECGSDGTEPTSVMFVHRGNDRFEQLLLYALEKCQVFDQQDKLKTVLLQLRANVEKKIADFPTPDIENGANCTIELLVHQHKRRFSEAGLREPAKRPPGLGVHFA